ncbi:alpha/beta fold hydrolase [Pseudidiomarina taiwanensis]|uniref:Alpha/beta hydrolase n=1 Tax=Pseudidiomarina taiwanensis TaxID=337250 RepID=A0A432ZFJ2_9GAMM|nr:alpha/beta hydrolase [Pseudidiomarina taiwanensis]RUO76737.1 alpha/beta hydrolase [Pseudidiomarina taiwanensis]
MSAKLGLKLYDAVMAFEAKLYGFKKAQVQTKDLKLSYYIRSPRGAKQTLLLLHGYTASKELWLRFAKQFNKMTDNRFQIIIPDLGGHGESDYDPERSYTPKAQVERLCDLLDALSIKQVSVAGNSMGGLIAANFALFEAERVEQVIAIDPAGVKTPEPSEVQKLFEQGKSPFLIHSEEDFRRFYPLTMARPPWMPDMFLRGMALRYQARREAYVKIFQDFFANDQLDKRLTDITCPTMVIWGEQDRIIDVSGAKRWRELLTKEGLPLPRVEIFSGFGHMPMVEAPAKTAAVCRDFLES